MSNPRVFLGGTCAKGTSWREKLIPQLMIPYFNPVNPHWDEAARLRELEERETCAFCLYVITPKMQGFYSIAEVADDSNKRPEKTIFCFLPEDGDETFTRKQLYSLKEVGKLVARNGGIWVESLEAVAAVLNGTKTDSS